MIKTIIIIVWICNTKYNRLNNLPETFKNYLLQKSLKQLVNKNNTQNFTRWYGKILVCINQLKLKLDQVQNRTFYH